jgi:hydrogenase expression/formation protein HypC
MCVAVPGRILKTSGDNALVDFQGNRMKVSIALTPDAGVAEWVLVHAGFAISKIDEAAARETWSYLTQMYGDEDQFEANLTK